MKSNSTTQVNEFLKAVEALCGEANEAARLAPSIFDEPQRKQVSRALARCMELMEQEVLPSFYAEHPESRRTP